MAALVVAAFAQIGDRPAWLAAILSDHDDAPGKAIGVAALALAAASGVMALLGMLLAPRLTPEARQLMLAVALLLQAGGAVRAPKRPARPAGMPLDRPVAPFVGLFVLICSGGVPFVVMCLAMRSPVPALAAVGATLGGIIPIAAAAVLGERGWLRLPLVTLGRVVAGLFVLAALWLGLGALRLT